MSLDDAFVLIERHPAWYSFCQVRSTLRVALAVEVGVTDHTWSTAELAGLTDDGVAKAA